MPSFAERSILFSIFVTLGSVARNLQARTRLRSGLSVLAAVSAIGAASLHVAAPVAAQTVNLSVSPNSMAESASETTVEITATISATLSADLTVDVAVSHLSRTTFALDPATVPSITITAGQRSNSVEVDVTPTENLLDTGDEVVTFAGTSTTHSSATIVSAALTIVDNDEPPILQSSTVDGPSLTLTYNKSLASGSAPHGDQYTVLVGGVARTVSSTAVSTDDDKQLVLTLATSVKAGERVTVAYTHDSRSGGGTPTALTDTGTNPAASFSTRNVTNNTPIPRVVIARAADEEGPANMTDGFNVTITFRDGTGEDAELEPVSDFVQGDITVSNGSVASFSSTSGAEYTANITPAANGNVTVSVAANVATSTVTTTPNSASNSVTVRGDVTAPTVSITGPTTTQTGAFTVTIRFSESVTGFELSEISVGNGSASDLSPEEGPASTYTARITPSSGTNTVTVDVGVGVAEDAAGNSNSTGAPQYSVQADKADLAVTISGPSGTQTGGEFVVTFRFSSSVSGFVEGDIDVTNGDVVVGSLTSTSSQVYRATIRPSGSGTVAVTVDVPDGVSDGSGEAYPASNTFTVQAAVGPTVTITGTPASGNTITDSQPLNLTVTFTEAVTGFSLSDIRVTNGTPSNLVSAQTSYSATVTPTVDDVVTVQVPANAARTTSGGSRGNSSATATWNGDVSPTVVITGPSGTVTEAFDVTITFEDQTGVSDFTASDFEVSANASISTPTADPSGQTKIFTATVTPIANGRVTVRLPADAVIDGASNGNKVSNTFAVTASGFAATPVLLSSVVNGPALTLTYNNDLDDATAPGSAQYTVLVNSINRTVGTPAVSGKTVTLPLTPSVKAGESVTVTYTDSPTALRDDGGRAVPTFTGRNVSNNTPTPSVEITRAGEGPINSGGFTATFTFSEDVTGFDAVEDITVTNGTATAPSGSGSDYTSTITPTTTGNVTVSVAAGVAESSVTTTPNSASNRLTVTADITAPGVTISGPTGTQTGPFTITIRFSEAVTGFEESEISVGNGAVSSLSPTEGPASRYTATITPGSGSDVTVDVGSNVAVDAAQNPNTAAPQYTVPANKAALSVRITGPSGLQRGGEFRVTFRFSSTVGDFGSGDISLSNGVLVDGPTASSRSVYTATIRPAGSGEVDVDVNIGSSVTDGTTDTYPPLDTPLRVRAAVGPTVTVSGSGTATESSPVTLTVTFSEAVTGFVLSDIRVTNGRATDFDQSAAPTYTAMIRPVRDGPIQVEVRANAARSTANNYGNSSGSVGATDITGDAAPTVVIAGPTTTVAGAFPVTITFDDANGVIGLMADEIEVSSNASVEGIDPDATTRTKVYTAVILPKSSGRVTVRIPEDVAQDLSTNDNRASNTFAVTANVGPASGVSLAVDPETVSEADGATEIEVTATVVGNRTYRVDRTLTVRVRGSGNDNVVEFDPVADFEITIAAGAETATGTFIIDPTDDDDNQGPETITVSGTLDNGDQVTSTTVTLTDDDARPSGVQLTASPATVAENAGATTITVTAQVTGDRGAVYNEDRTVEVTVAGSGTDGVVGFAAVPRFEIEIPANMPSATGTFVLTPTNNNIDEQNETITIRGELDNNHPVVSATLTLTDDEGAAAGFTLSVSPETIAENAGATTVTVTATAAGSAYNSAQSIPIKVAGSGAEGVVGFEPAADFTLTVPSGQLSATAEFTLTPVDNEADEVDETITLTGTHGDATLTAMLTLTDDDEPPTGIALAVSPTTVGEGAGATNVTLTATVEGGTTFGADQILQVKVAGSGDAGAVDFDPVADFNLTIPAGDATGTATFTLTPEDDIADEADETITITARHGGTSLEATLSLTDDDDAPTGISLSVRPAIVNEGAGATRVTVTATVEGGTTYGAEQTVSVKVAGSGTAGAVKFDPVSDFVITVPAEMAAGTATFTLTPEDNLIDEVDETITLTGLHGENELMATFVLADDDAAPTGIVLSVSPTTVNEGAGATTVTVTATVEGGTTYALDQTVSLSVAGSGNPGVVKFAPVSGFDITVPAGRASGSATFTLTPEDNVIDEANETVTVTGLHGETSIAALLMLADNDAAPTGIALSANPATVDESAGATTVTLTAMVEGGTTYGLDQTLRVTVAGSGTEEAVDFDPVSDFDLTVPAGQNMATATFMLTPDDDLVDETDETVTVTARHGERSLTASITVTDNDAAPTGIALSVNPATVDEGAGATTVTVTATVEGGTRYAADQTVGVTVAGSGAAGVVQFSPISGFDILVPAGEVMGTATFTVTPEDNVIDEADETITLTGRHSGETLMTTLVLADDDAPPTGITLSVDPSTINEDAGATSVTVTAAVGGGTTYATDKTVGITVSGSGSGNAVGFSPVQAFNIIVPAGTAAATGAFTITPVDNRVREMDETVSVTGNYNGASTSATLMLIDDDASLARYAEVNQIILPELARAMTASSVGAVAARVGKAQSRTGIDGMALKVGGHTTLDGFLRGYRMQQAYGGIMWQDRLSGTAFEFSPGALAMGGRITIWGEGDYRSLSGIGNGILDWNGNMTGIHLGTDANLGSGVLVGVAVSSTGGSVDYTYSGGRNQDTQGGSVEGTYEATMKSVQPYVSWSWSPGSNIWVSTGLGSGDVEIDDDEAAREASDSRMTVAAAGGSLRLLGQSSGLGGGTTLDLKGEAWRSRINLDGNGSLIDETTVDVNRLRVSLEGAYGRVLSGGAVLSPFVELGLRSDGGDGATGLGVEVGGGLRFATSSSGFTMEGRGRTLLAHGGDVEEWGVSGSIGYAPGSGGRGMSVEVGTSAGTAAGGLNRIWSDRMVSRAYGMGGLEPRLDSEIGYGVELKGGVLRSYGGLEMSELAGLGTRVGSQYRIGPRFSVGLELEHRAFPGEAARLPMVRGTIALR